MLQHSSAISNTLAFVLRRELCMLVIVSVLWTQTVSSALPNPGIDPTTGVINYPFGTLLPIGSIETCDSALLTPVINLAIKEAMDQYRVNYMQNNDNVNPPPSDPKMGAAYYFKLQSNACDSVNVFSAALGAVKLISPDKDADGNLPSASTIMLGRIIVGPACSYSLMGAAMIAISPTKPAMLLTGRAELLYSIRDVGMTVRTSYSIYNLWYVWMHVFFV